MSGAPGSAAGAGPRDELATWFWIELREPGKVPQRKGQFLLTDMAKTLRDFFAARPHAFMTVVTIDHDGPHFQDAPEVLEMLDGRSRSLARRHRESTRAAFAAHAAPLPLRADRPRAGSVQPDGGKP